MILINKLVNTFCAKRLREIDRLAAHPFQVQEEVWKSLIHKARDTVWGREHGYASMQSIDRFQQNIPLQGYDEIKPYIDRIRSGEQNLLWPGATRWFAKSSGTTENKSKFVPVTREALQSCHFRGGRDVIALYARNFPKTKLFSGRTLTLGGSHQIDTLSAHASYGDLSAVMLQHTPAWVSLLRTPPLKIALLSDFYEKVNKIAEVAVKQRVVSFAGVPSWNLVLMKHVLEYTGKSNVLEVWPDMELFIHGGVSFLPYREQYARLFPSSNMHYMETYNASEGFFALQDDPLRDDMLLLLDYHVFFEFVPLDQLHKERPVAYTIDGVQTGVNYAVVISTNSGLWRYLIGDTIVFTSLFPHKIKISGRTKQYINAFGEELIVDNAEKALHEACRLTGAVVLEYTAGPVYMDSKTNGAHEWLIEFERQPESLEAFTGALDKALCSLNSDYEAKRSRDITLRMPLVRAMPQGTFYRWMQTRGKMGGQHKVPRLSNNRSYIEEILSV